MTTIRAALPSVNIRAYNAFVILMEHAIQHGCGPRSERVTSTALAVRVTRAECATFDALERTYRELCAEQETRP